MVLACSRRLHGRLGMSSGLKKKWDLNNAHKPYVHRERVENGLSHCARWLDIWIHPCWEGGTSWK